LQRVIDVAYGSVPTRNTFRFSPDAYAIGINVVLYAMSHERPNLSRWVPNTFLDERSDRACCRRFAATFGEAPRI
jgi:hypothetical protein